MDSNNLPIWNVEVTEDVEQDLDNYVYYLLVEKISYRLSILYGMYNYSGRYYFGINLIRRTQDYLEKHNKLKTKN